MNTPKTKAAPKIAILAGEASGDQLGADLAKNLSETYPNSVIYGIGADKMTAAGVNCWWHSDQLTVFGLVEVLRHVPRLLKLRRRLLKTLLSWQPDIVISIDAPDFYLPLAKQLKRQGIKVIHYVCPSVWAWRQGRVHMLRKSVDHVLCLLPFEQAFLTEHQVSATFVGHSLIVNASLDLNQQYIERRHQYKLGVSETIVAVLPGSRDGEIKRHTDIFFQACRMLKGYIDQPLKLVTSTSKPEHQVILKQAHQKHCPMLELKIVEDATTALRVADVALLASGTVTLEAILNACPMVVAYVLNSITWQIIQKFNLYKAAHVALPNLLANGLASQRLVPEILQNDANPENLAKTLYNVLQQDQQVYQRHCELLIDKLSTEYTPAVEVVNHMLLEKC